MRRRQIGDAYFTRHILWRKTKATCKRSSTTLGLPIAIRSGRFADWQYFYIYLLFLEVVAVTPIGWKKEAPVWPTQSAR